MSSSASIPQAIECQLVRNKQINAAFLFLFENELSVVKCAEIYAPNSLNQEDSKKKSSTIIDNEILCSVFPR